MSLRRNKSLLIALALLVTLSACCGGLCTTKAAQQEQPNVDWLRCGRIEQGPCICWAVGYSSSWKFAPDVACAPAELVR